MTATFGIWRPQPLPCSASPPARHRRRRQLRRRSQRGGAPTTSHGQGTGGGGTSIPTLVSVNLQNVLNDLSVSLQVNRDNIPVTAQVPIAVAASVCGVSVDVLAASIANGHAGCTATTTLAAAYSGGSAADRFGRIGHWRPQTMGGATTNNLM